MQIAPISLRYLRKTNGRSPRFLTVSFPHEDLAIPVNLFRFFLTVCFLPGVIQPVNYSNTFLVKVNEEKESRLILNSLNLFFTSALVSLRNCSKLFYFSLSC